RPMLHTFKKVLANSEPSTHGGKADIAVDRRKCPLMTQSGHRETLPLCQFEPLRCLSLTLWGRKCSLMASADVTPVCIRCTQGERLVKGLAAMSFRQPLISPLQWSSP